MTENQKNIIKKKIKSALRKEKEITKIIVFGSFNKSSEPNDIDIAIFQNSNLFYLNLAMKYRRLTREIAKIIPIDIVPLRDNGSTSFIQEIEAGEVIYER